VAKVADLLQSSGLADHLVHHFEVVVLDWDPAVLGVIQWVVSCMRNVVRVVMVCLLAYRAKMAHLVCYCGFDCVDGIAGCSIHVDAVDSTTQLAVVVVAAVACS